jgi:predicted short-subunit dehydrogenase-like oxidoreductase (DUF2520 family)
VVGAGRLGTALARALRAVGTDVEGPLGRDEAPEADVVVLCVPDHSIRAAATALARRPRWVGHTSGATCLAAIEPAARSGAFSVHPLGAFPLGDPRPHPFAGLGCAVAGSNRAALGLARDLARRLGMEPFEVPEADRPAYHAAASLASNFVVTLLGAATDVAEGAGVSPERVRPLLAPLARGALDTWVGLGAARALTGPVARGDEATVARQRAALADAHPELLPLWDVLVARTRALAGASPRAAA